MLGRMQDSMQDGNQDGMQDRQQDGMHNKADALKIDIPADIEQTELFGNLDANIKLIENATGTNIVLRDDALLIRGENTELAVRIISRLIDALRIDPKLDRQRLGYIVDMEISGHQFDEKANSKDIICYTHMGKPLRPKTAGQKEYIDKIRRSDMVFCIGPAGTGKTYLACAMAVTAYKNRQIDRIILTRPAVEAGERLGFLPGDMQEKVDPYLRPLYDAMYDILGMESAEKLKEKGAVEVVPLAYMRGRTLDNAFIILDEAQNTTLEQMKMFLTRMGFNSKMVITGDITQIDLPYGKASGLKEACSILKDVEGIEISYLTEVDVVRHELVKRIIKAFQKKGL